MDKVRIGIAGLGNMGTGHAKYLIENEVPNAVLAAVCDQRPERLAWAAEHLGNSVARFADYRTMLASGTVDGVIINTPHYFHPEQAILAFRQGLHVLIEKPAGVYTKQVREMNEAAAEAGCLFGIMYNQLFYGGCRDAKVLHSKVGNFNSKAYPELEDYGDATLAGDNGATCYFRVDWLTPDGLGTWGDGRTVILGTKGYIELRKYIDIGRDGKGDHVYVVDGEKERHIEVSGQVGYPYFGQLILDCIHRTENAMTQEHAFKAAELCMLAQQAAVRME